MHFFHEERIRAQAWSPPPLPLFVIPRGHRQTAIDDRMFTIPRTTFGEEEGCEVPLSLGELFPP